VSLICFSLDVRRGTLYQRIKIIMVLTEEQKEKIRKNRARALEIQKRRREEAMETEVTARGSEQKGPPAKRSATTASQIIQCGTTQSMTNEKGNESEELELEAFEEGASKYVTKKEAMKMYLLPEGTLAICKYEERPNPHHNKFQPMKLYDRAEVRRLSRERFGGLQGLIEERKRREEKRYQKDLEATKNLFKK
jgi:hypothetical protein